VGAILSYADEVTKAMEWLGNQPMTVFVGQQVRFDGQRLHATLKGVPMERRIEMPVAENFQMGFCTGLALEGYIPISVYPRFDFLLLAADALINHLDKLPLMGGFKPKVIIRTAVGSSKPLDPGHQHTQDHTEAFRKMLHTVEIFEITKPMEDYQAAFHHPGSVLCVERMEFFK
jgi:pyruvate/2-oxoglutarate/acetoin dehydrogenase E1 component